MAMLSNMLIFIILINKTAYYALGDMCAAST